MTITRTAILLAAFGSSTRVGEATLRVFEERVRLAFPGLPVRWAFTSAPMRHRLAAARKKTDSVQKALCRMGFERYTHVAVQSLHLIPGAEYETLLEETEAARALGGPRNICVGLPLLAGAEDVALAAKALLSHLPDERKPGEAVLCMGHGTWHAGAAGYQSLAGILRREDEHIYIGTLEGEHSIERMLPLIAASGARTVWLLPLLSVVGKHAEEDMAGAHAGSWRGRIEAAGLNCRPVLKGTAEYAGFVDIWIAHLNRALKKLAKSP